MTYSLYWIRYVLLTVGFIGTVLFFPISLGDNFTCLFHRLIGDVHNHSDEQLENLTQPVHSSEGGKSHSASLNFYIRHFSIYWWGSLLILACGIYYPRITRYLKGERHRYPMSKNSNHSN